MNVNLSPVFEDYIKQQLKSGLYNNASEVVRDALRLKMQQAEVYQSKLNALRGAISAGIESGAPIPLDINEMILEAKKDVSMNA